MFWSLSSCEPRQLRGVQCVAGPRAAGLSLIELLVAVAFMSIVMLAAGGATLESMRRNRESELHTLATALVQDVAECLRTHYAGVGPVPSNCMSVSSNCMPSGLPAGSPSMSCVSPDPEVATPAGMTSFRVRATWSGQRPGSVAFHSLID